MAGTPWLEIAGQTVFLESIPSILERGQLLLPLIRRLLIESCISGIEISEDQQLAFQRKFLEQNGIKSDEDLRSWLAKNKLTEDQASRNILESLQLDTYKRKEYGSSVEKVFLETKDRRDRVVYSLLRVESQSVASELYLRLQEGDSTFTDLCQRYSVGNERDTGGLIGPVALGRLHPNLAELLRLSNPGQLWQPLEIDGNWVVVRLDKKLPAQLDESLELQILDECFEAWVSTQLSQFMQAYSSLNDSSQGDSGPAMTSASH
ncbi:MAG: peptidylprolyl isomerase [Cyanobium sp. NAT70]|nr:peptidylprolyl isomerase [Cyanobium sp. NAT70]|tara:strand:- start:597 stop:1385 length:789 start_codon:yes stop_codon:yes gene_type:complete